ncbi:hypothetical protein ALMP_11900 [Streptomyces sp. A012304]|nr:hypothetical protein ALMP_11900 [Streptomyces sp. A012304]
MRPAAIRGDVNPGALAVQRAVPQAHLLTGGVCRAAERGQPWRRWEGGAARPLAVLAKRADQPAKTVGQSEEPALGPFVDDGGAEAAECPEPDQTVVTKCDTEVTIGG